MRHAAIIVRFLCCTLFTVFPTVAHAVITGEYPILPAQTISGVDSGLAAGPDGSIWFTDTVGHSIGRITPAGVVTIFPLPPGGQLTGGITAGPDGNLWFTEAFSGTIGTMTPDGLVTEFPVSIDSPRRITTGSDGNLWFTGGNIIGRITPTGVVTEFSLPGPGTFSVGITAGPDGNLWFVEIGANKIGRITTAGHVTEFPVLSLQPELFSIIAGPDGNLWFTEGNKIGRITPAGVVTEFPIPTPESSSLGITAGPDGNLWFTDMARHEIGRITPSGTFLAAVAPPSPISGPQHLTTSPDGLIWFTESNTNKIGLIFQANISTYFPLASGNSWTYQENGVDGFTRTVMPGVFKINTIDTKRTDFSNGEQIYFTNDSNGIREHREYDPTPPATTVTLNPPFKFGDAQTSLGVPVMTSGTAKVSGYTDPFPYTGSSTFQALDVITVPAGTFRAARIEASLSILGMTATQTIWVADNVGVVKEIVDVDTYVLSSTNVTNTTPGIFWFLPQTGAERSMLVSSNTITVTGITAPTGISVSGGEYSIDGGGYTSASGTVTNGHTVTVRLASSSDFATRTTATLNIGGVTGTFSVTTGPRPPQVSLSLVGQFPVDAGPIVRGDWNRDGKQDLAVAHWGTNSVSILLGDGTGSFGSATKFPVGEGPRALTAGDFNQDGNLDCAVANETFRFPLPPGTVSILLGTGTGSFAPATNVEVGLRPLSLAAGDFNRDGSPDLVTANDFGSDVSVLLGTESGDFLAATSFAVGFHPKQVAIGDLNDDDNLDLAVVNSDDGTVSILLGMGSGAFSGASDFGAGTLPMSVAIGDVNQDGRLDLAVANDGTNHVTVLLGDGTGSFGSGTTFVAGEFPRSVSMGDLDGDGNLDLIVTKIFNGGSGDNAVCVLLGDGTGSFWPPVTVLSAPNAGSWDLYEITGDLNRDGKPDLAVTYTSSNTVAVFLNRWMIGDINSDDAVDLADAILALQVSANLNPSQTAHVGADVNHDSRLGIEDAAYILQVVSGLK